jgi:hypothetical protein
MLDSNSGLFVITCASDRARARDAAGRPSVDCAVMRRALVVIVVASLLSAAAALAAKPVKGATYSGTISRGSLPITLKVSGNGRSVKVNVPNPPLFCQGGGGGTTQSTKAAAITNGGTFTAKISYVFKGKVVFSAKVTGKFGAARGESGKITVTYKTASCSGTSSYSTHA